MIDQVVHLADAYSWILRAEPESVYAVGNRIVHSDATSSETSGLVMLTYPDGIFGSIDCSWNQPATSPAGYSVMLSVVGDEGTVDAEPTKQRLSQFDDLRGMSWLQWGMDAYVLMIREFLDCVSGERPPCLSDVDGLRAAQVASAARQSLGSGAPVSLSAG